MFHEAAWANDDVFVPEGYKNKRGHKTDNFWLVKKEKSLLKSVSVLDLHQLQRIDRKSINSK